MLLFKKELTGNYVRNPELPMLIFFFLTQFALHIMQFQLINFIFTKYSVQCKDLVGTPTEDGHVLELILLI